MRYLVMGPADNGTLHLGSALTPTLTRQATGFQSKGRVFGRPGTERITAPPPAAVSQHYDNMANSGTSRSSDAPDWILPRLYYETGNAYGDHEHAPVARLSDNQMPIPATRPANVLVFNSYTPRKGGQRQVVQPQVIQQWRGLKGTING